MGGLLSETAPRGSRIRRAGDRGGGAGIEVCWACWQPRLGTPPQDGQALAAGLGRTGRGRWRGPNAAPYHWVTGGVADLGVGAKCDAPITSILPVSAVPMMQAARPPRPRPQDLRPAGPRTASGPWMEQQSMSRAGEGPANRFRQLLGHASIGSVRTQSMAETSGGEPTFPRFPIRVPAINQSCTPPPFLSPSIQSRARCRSFRSPVGFFLAHHPRCPLPGTSPSIWPCVCARAMRHARCGWRDGCPTITLQCQQSPASPANRLGGSRRVPRTCFSRPFGDARLHESTVRPGASWPPKQASQYCFLGISAARPD